MKFCSECGHSIETRTFENETKQRFFCPACDIVHYQNPKVLVAIYATWQDKILWMRRNTEPLKGLWEAPSGYVEENEDLVTAAVRELREETHAEVDVNKIQLHMVGNLLHMNQIYIVYQAPLLEPRFKPTEEASEVQLFSRDDFPIDEFAYPEVADNVDLIYRDLARGEFGVYTGVLSEGKNTVNAVGHEED